MKYRPQRGGYEDSMAQAVILDSTYESLARHLDVSVKDIAVYFYCHDTRDGWENTFIVTVDGDAVGFTDRVGLGMTQRG